MKKCVLTHTDDQKILTDKGLPKISHTHTLYYEDLIKIILLISLNISHKKKKLLMSHKKDKKKIIIKNMVHLKGSFTYWTLDIFGSVSDSCDPFFI